MSRIGKQSIKISENIEVKIIDDQVSIRGPKGELTQSIPPQLEITLKEEELLVTLVKKTKDSSALWGLIRALLFNMVKGVTEGFEKKLEIEGVGYRASLQGNKLILNLGFSLVRI